VEAFFTIFPDYFHKNRKQVSHSSSISFWNIASGGEVQKSSLREGIFEPGRNKEQTHGTVFPGQTLLPNKVPQ